jgi:micrococcal nuclease
LAAIDYAYSARDGSVAVSLPAMNAWSAAMKTLILAAAVMGCVACGDAATPATTQKAASPSATAAATRTPPATASPKPTPTVSPPPAPVQTGVTFLNAPLTVARGQNATLQVKTAANTSCSISVVYKSGPSTAAGLGPATSDAAGNVAWTWKVGATTTPGAWPITVTCGSGSAQTKINVT